MKNGLILALSPAVQHECIPQAILGMDVLCQAKSGMGKTAVFVLATLQQLEPKAGEISVVVLCHTRELAYQVTAPSPPLAADSLLLLQELSIFTDVQVACKFTEVASSKAC